MFLKLFDKNNIIKSLNKHLIPLLLSISIISTSAVLSACSKKDKEIKTSSKNETSSIISSSSALETSSEESSSSLKEESSDTQNSSEKASSKKEVSSKKESSSKKQSSSSKKATSSKKSTTNKTTSKGKYNYNTNLDIEDNIFMDSLIYTGYNMKKHRADGNMWTYILSRHKRGLGYLSDITYGGGSTGLETKNGKPNIEKFERGGLVCASFATYVYFNYLPNVAGIDTSALPRPEKTYAADDWYRAVKKWLKLGYSYSIPFTASKTSYNYIIFKPKQEIPIGSIIIFQKEETRTDRGSHVAIYAGYKNGQHWVYHVGTANGPEMCIMERMLFGPVAQWPLLVVSTPNNVRMSAALEVTINDDNDKPIANVPVKIKHKATGKTTVLGKTNKKGVVLKEGLKYDEYEVIQTIPDGYTSKETSKTISLTPKNNSKNEVTFTNTKDKPEPTSSSEASSENKEESLAENQEK